MMSSDAEQYFEFNATLNVERCNVVTELQGDVWRTYYQYSTRYNFSTRLKCVLHSRTRQARDKQSASWTVLQTVGDVFV